MFTPCVSVDYCSMLLQLYIYSAWHMASSGLYVPTTVPTLYAHVRSETSSVFGRTASVYHRCVVFREEMGGNLALKTKSAAVTITATAAANNFPPLDRDTTLDVGYGPCARIVNVVSGWAGAIGATKAVTADVRIDARWEKFGTRTDVRTTVVAATAIADASRKRAAPRDIRRLLRVLRGFDAPDDTSRELPSPTPPAVLLRTTS